jgi:hypothetical protein
VSSCRSAQVETSVTLAYQRVVHDAVLATRLLVEQVAESRDPVFAVMGGRAKHRIGDSGLVEAAELLVAADFFDAEVEWIGLMRIDQERRDTCASEHGGRGRAGKAAADDRDVGVFHGNPAVFPLFCARKSE